MWLKQRIFTLNPLDNLCISTPIWNLKWQSMRFAINEYLKGSLVYKATTYFISGCYGSYQMFGWVIGSTLTPCIHSPWIHNFEQCFGPTSPAILSNFWHENVIVCCQDWYNRKWRHTYCKKEIINLQASSLIWRITPERSILNMGPHDTQVRGISDFPRGILHTCIQHQMSRLYIVNICSNHTSMLPSQNLAAQYLNAKHYTNLFVTRNFSWMAWQVMYCPPQPLSTFKLLMHVCNVALVQRPRMRLWVISPMPQDQFLALAKVHGLPTNGLVWQNRCCWLQFPVHFASKTYHNLPQGFLLHPSQAKRKAYKVQN